MEFYLPNIAFYLMALLVSSTLLFAVGRTIVCLLPEWRDEKNAYQTIFNSYMLGYVLILPIFAIIWSRGNTIFLMTAILWLIYLLWWRKPCKAVWKIDWRSELTAFIVSVSLLLGSFAFLYYFCFVRSEGQMFSDQIYASNLTQSILTYHNEAYFRTDVSLAQTYHWGDSWTTALWSWIFNAKPIYVLYCVTYPFLLSMCILGLISIAKNRSLPVLWCVILGILFFFYWNLTSLITPWHGRAYIFDLKGYLMLVFIIWSAAHIMANMYAKGLFAALMLVSYYSPMSAGVLTLVCLLSYFMPDRPKFTLKELFNPYVIGAVLIAVGFGLFYMLQPDIFTEGAFTRHAEHSNMWVLGFIVKRLCRPIATMTPIALITGFFIYKSKSSGLHKYVMLYSCILSSCLVACIVGGYASKFEINAGQIAANFYETISCLFVFVSLIYLLSEFATHHKYVAYSIIMALGIIYPANFFFKGAQSVMFPVAPMSVEENNAYTSLQTIFRENPVREMGYMRNYTLPENYNNPKTEYDLYFPMDRLVHILPQGYHPYCLSAYDMPVDIDPKWNDMAECELWQYGAKLMKVQPNCTMEQIMESFIAERGINYIFVEKGAILPKFLTDKFNKVFEWDYNVLYYAE